MGSSDAWTRTLEYRLRAAIGNTLMSNRDVAVLASRILALTILALSLHAIVSLPLTLTMGIWELVRFREFGDVGFLLLFSSIPVGLQIGLIWFLWTRAVWIAERMVPDRSQTRWPRIRATDLQVAAFSTVGLLTLLESIRELCVSFGQYMDLKRRAISITFLDWFTMQPTLLAIAFGALGLWLLIGSRDIVRLVRRLRSSVSEPEQAVETLPPEAEAEA